MVYSQRFSKPDEFRICVGNSSYQRRSDFKTSDYITETVHVIGIGMGSQHIINSIKSAPPKVFRHHRLANAASVALDRLFKADGILCEIESRPATAIDE